MKKYLAEFVGTFVLVLVGVGSAVLDGKALGPIGISLAFGLTLVAMAYAIGPISGCHINPAVTVGLAVAGKCKWADVPGYVVAQCVGAIAASFALVVIAGGVAGGYDVATAGFAANGFGDHSPGGYGLAAAFLTEMFFTFVLVLTVLGATADKAPAGFAGLPIGFALAVTNFAAIPVTNASINPARSLGPALFVGGWALGQLWLFILAPIAGGILAAIVYQLVRE
jgi:aquaporin Z